MKLTLLCLLGILVSAYGVSLEKFTDFIVADSVREYDLGHTGCSCFRHFCYCEGKEDDVKVGATLMVNELRHNCRHVLISIRFFIGEDTVEKDFPANEMEDFCEFVEGKKYCFRFNIHTHRKGFYLKGCMEMSRPHLLNMGCFKLPLLTSCNEDDANDDVIPAIETEYESESTEELRFEPYDM